MAPSGRDIEVIVRSGAVVERRVGGNLTLAVQWAVGGRGVREEWFGRNPVLLMDNGTSS
jgi:hypothetical protein